MNNLNQKNKPNVYAIGESLLDIIFKLDETVTAKPGGSMLNACISLGRLGHNVHFLTEYGNDKAGDKIEAFLYDNNVYSNFSVRHKERKSSLALAWLNESGNASYSFYQDLPTEAPSINLPAFNQNDILLFGSFYAINSRNNSNILHLLQQAKAGGASVIYDPNIRPAKFKDTQETRNQIMELIEQVDIVKASDEDFAYIFRTANHTEVLENLKKLKKLFFVTCGKNGVDIVFNNEMTHLSIPLLEPVSTVGAGDNFNAGIIHALLSQEIKMPFTSADILSMAQHGIALASEVCLRTENYIARR
jgi:fructokinase